MLKHLALVLLLTGCSADRQKVAQVLSDEGCTDIVDTGWSLFSGCDEKDSFVNEFECTRNNHRVKGVVCSGWIKGYTVRWK